MLSSPEPITRTFTAMNMDNYFPSINVLMCKILEMMNINYLFTLVSI